MNVVGQNAHGDGLERMPLLDGLVRLAQAIDVADEQIARPIGQRHGEEELAAPDPGATVA